MDKHAAIRDFVAANRKPFAGYVRDKLLAAGAKDYVAKLGRDGIAAMERESAGMLLDLACALVNRLDPSAALTPERALAKMTAAEAASIKLPRSEAHDNVMASLLAMKDRDQGKADG